MSSLYTVDCCKWNTHFHVHVVDFNFFLGDVCQIKLSQIPVRIRVLQNEGRTAFSHRPHGTTKSSGAPFPPELHRSVHVYEYVRLCLHTYIQMCTEIPDTNRILLFDLCHVVWQCICIIYLNTFTWHLNICIHVYSTCMYIYISVHIYICKQMCVYTRIFMYIYIQIIWMYVCLCVCVCLCVKIYTWTFIHIHTCTHVYMYTYVYACEWHIGIDTYIYIYIYICTCVYIYIVFANSSTSPKCYIIKICIHSRAMYTIIFFE